LDLWIRGTCRAFDHSQPQAPRLAAAVRYQHLNSHALAQRARHSTHRKRRQRHFAGGAAAAPATFAGFWEG
jgi:hypothetical protein